MTPIKLHCENDDGYYDVSLFFIRRIYDSGGLHVAHTNIETFFTHFQGRDGEILLEHAIIQIKLLLLSISVVVRGNVRFRTRKTQKKKTKFILFSYSPRYDVCMTFDMTDGVA